ncbi:MAG: TonB-dependent receptor domain-containing protein, partial [bacterium]
MFKRKRLTTAVKLACAGAISTGVVITPVFAAEGGEPQQLQKVTKTGSHIKTIDVEGPTPLFVISAEDIENQGFSNVQEVLDALPQNLGGSVDASFTFGFTPGGSSIDLRGLGNGRSLVLLDGRRMPIYPVGLSGTDNFVDLSAIPTVIIDRIEVLTDGASAIYGADAVSGVINIITRQDYDGIQASVRYGDTTNGGYQHGRIQAVAGKTTEDTNATVFLEHWDNSEIKAKDRDYAGSDIANPRGVYSIGGSSFLDYDTGNVLQDPNCGTPNDSIGGLGIPDQNIPVFLADNEWCSFNRTAFRQLWAEQDRTSLGLKFDTEVNNDLTLFGSAGFTTKHTTTQLEPNFYAGPVFGYDSPGGVYPEGASAYIAPGAANNPIPGNVFGGEYVRRLVEFGPRSSDIDELAYNLLAGARGTFMDADWEWGISYSTIKMDVERPNIILSGLNSYINGSNGALNLFEPIPQDVVDELSYTQWREAESSVWQTDLVVTGDTGFELPGGQAAYAVIGEFAREWYDDISDPITMSGDNFDGASAGGGARKRYAFGAEFNLPVHDTVEISLAGRYDKYDDESDVGGAFSPKIAGSWRPMDTLMVRASWGESFRAPDMQRLFGADTVGFQTVNDPVTGLQVPSVEIRTGSNLALEEEEGENLNIGVVWEPIEDLTLKADYYDIEVEGLITSLGEQFILNECGADQSGSLCHLVHRDAFGTLNGGYIESNAQNLSFQSVNGVDFTVEYNWDIGDYGDMDLNLLWAWVDSVETQLTDSSPVVENIGLATIPENRVSFVADWNRQAWGATLRFDWIDEMCGVNGFECTSDEFIDSYSLVNGTVRYDADNYGRFLLGVHNIFDEDPADDPTNAQWPWFYNNGG